ncbi:MAG: hypothetical protein MN733_24170, partial [Nitrososphaera sp.]|nr:hypothetical protein [Nitrososphaera sp.]
VDAINTLSLAGNSSVICIDNGVLNIVRIFLSTYAKRRVNFYTSLSTAGYVTPTDEEFDLLEDLIDGFLGDTNVNCNDFLNALQNIATSIQISGGAGCCTPGSGGFNGSGSSAQPPSSFDDTGTNFPDGFDDRQEWLDHRCGYIVYLLAGISGDLDRAEVVSVVGMTISSLLAALGFALLTPIPFDDLIVLGLAIISALGTVGLFSSAISQAQAVVESEELKCALFIADNAAEAAMNAADEVLSQTEALSEPLRQITRDILNSFLTMDVINPLFENDGRNYPPGDCSMCVAPCESGFAIATGTGPTPPEYIGTYSSAVLGIYQGINVTSMDAGNDGFIVQSIVGGAPYIPADGDRFRIRSVGAPPGVWDLYQSDTSPVGQTFTNVEQWIFLSSPLSPFDVVLTCPV